MIGIEGAKIGWLKKGHAMTDTEWPESILFISDGIQANFATYDDLNRWCAEERAAWNAAIGESGGNHWASSMVANMNTLQSLLTDQSKSNMQAVANTYRPSNGTLARFVSRIKNPQTRWGTFSEITKPGSTGSQTGGDFVQARALAAFYQAIGNNLIGVEQAGEIAYSVRAAIDDVNRLRDSDQAFIDLFNGLLSRCEVDWKNKVEGFETRARLAAPRTYWNDRSQRHGLLAEADRKTWLLSVWALVVLILVAAALNLYFQPQKDPTSEITSTIQRLIVFGSLLAVAVWWLRQKLRDVRMHEHFSEGAAERATMIETYAAMRGEGLQDKDLSIIVAALYRPAAGNMADDTGPVLPTEAVVRALAEVAGKK